MHKPKSTTDKEALLPKHITSHDLVNLFGTGTHVSLPPPILQNVDKMKKGIYKVLLRPFFVF
jgi:hypothetical protein